VTTQGLALVALIGFLDGISGYEISFSIFYLAPITLVTWQAGRRAGFAVASLSALVWLGADLLSGHPFTHLIIPFWNALVRLSFFLIVVSLLARLKHAYEEQRRIARALQEALAQVKVLSGLIPICAWCKKVRNDQGYWQQVEAYIAEHSVATLTHSICQDCEAQALQALRQRKR
jgi:hypothetical protein